MSTNYNKYPKGSEWRKWDLHIHSPKSFLNNKFDGTSIDDFANKISESKIVAVGLTNYFRFDDSELQNIKGVLNRKGIVVFPNIEFRTQPGNKENETMHIHVLFSNNVPVQNITDFLGRLKTFAGKYCKDLTVNDIENASVSIETLIKTLADDKNIQHIEDYLIIACPRGQGNFRPCFNDDGRGNSTAIVIDKHSDLLFGNNDDTQYFLSKDRYKNAEEKPVLLCSDAHNMEDIGSKFTWIKSDVTFEGLKQIIYEPEERVYIGENPPILDKVENNKTNYLNSLQVNQANENHTADTWFKNISIPFNKELVAIIGNKGSGKSGVADILGLVGNTHIDKKYFSFLHKDKFLKGKLADKFNAQIVWESGGESAEIRLNEGLKNEMPESVRFIPQNYFEELTNEIEINKFQHVLEDIIFEYIPNDEKFNKSSFSALEKYKTENVNTAIQQHKNKIKNSNNEIIKLEKKKHPDYLEKIEGLISHKEIQIKEQEKLLIELPTITNPSDNIQGLELLSDNIAKDNKELDVLKNTLKTKEIDRSNLTSKIEALKQFKSRIELQEQSINEFLQNHTNEAKSYSLDIKKILKIETDYSSINTLISDTETELTNINIYFESSESIMRRDAKDNNQSIIYKIEELTLKIKTAIDKLTGEQKTFHENEQKKSVINARIKGLTGDGENSENGTLNSLKTEKDFITNKLVDRLENERNVRVELSLEIFNKKTEVIELYNSFKGSVDEKITQNKRLLEDYDIKIESSFNFESNFYSEFLRFINQGKSGEFYGKEEGENKIKSIVEEAGYSDRDKIKTLLENIIKSLEENEIEISSQINSDKLNDFYDYIFSLNYIKPKYELKLGGKVLGQLSPGERGALLLIFYLMIDKEEIPLIIDQPEDNLDNESVYNMLSKFIKQAKRKRQIIMVTHNPNLAVGADAEQIIHVSIDKTNKNKFSFISGSIENPIINKEIVRILEGTKPAFDKRKLKYQEN